MRKRQYIRTPPIPTQKGPFANLQSSTHAIFALFHTFVGIFHRNIKTAGFVRRFRILQPVRGGACAPSGRNKGNTVFGAAPRRHSYIAYIALCLSFARQLYRSLTYIYIPIRATAIYIS